MLMCKLAKATNRDLPLWIVTTIVLTLLIALAAYGPAKAVGQVPDNGEPPPPAAIVTDTTKEPPLAGKGDPEDEIDRRVSRALAKHFDPAAVENMSVEELLNGGAKKAEPGKVGAIGAMIAGQFIAAIVKKIIHKIIIAILWSIIAYIVWHYIGYFLVAWLAVVLLPSWVIARVVAGRKVAAAFMRGGWSGGK